ncbi:hypothetical protein NLI96_g4730 [Meripilus lineatus]|uniref:RTA1-domain-containing protein n=1 Tax=Meripilus lineatus TaxID=2056292 RepID=A0AAD5YEI9_9APHY|nr:hypothetical protein NLI96_g4730 [Physisporinus lineatus]
MRIPLRLFEAVAMTFVSTPFLPLLACFLFLAEAPSAFAQSSEAPPRPADPYADPANDPYNILRYIASNTLAAIALVLLLLTAVSQTWLMRKMGGKFMLSMLIAEYTFATGIALRFGLHANPESKGLYIIENLLVVLSPCGFIAADYVLLGRLATFLESGQYLLISPRRITLVFVLSDVFTFLMQATGGSITISNNADTIKMGQNIRSVYRLVELSEGYFGKLSTTEGYFYGLDTLPLFIAIVVYTPFWPGRFIPDAANVPQRIDSDKVELDRLRSRHNPYNDNERSWGHGSRAALA